MGILYSHIVFQPPSPPSYSDDGGVMSFRKARQEGPDSDDDQSVAPSTDATVAGSSDPQYVQHPLIYLTTSRGNSIPAAYFHQPDSYYTILFSHVRFHSSALPVLIFFQLGLFPFSSLSSLFASVSPRSRVCTCMYMGVGV